MYGSICDDCFDELTHEFDGDSIRDFMNTRKGVDVFSKRKNFLTWCEEEFKEET